MLNSVAVVVLLTMFYVPLSLRLPFQKRRGLELFESPSPKCLQPHYCYFAPEKSFHAEPKQLSFKKHISSTFRHTRSPTVGLYSTPLSNSLKLCFRIHFTVMPLSFNHGPTTLAIIKPQQFNRYH